MAVISDIVDGNSAILTRRGWEFNRIFYVSELSTTGSNMLVEAVETSGVPKRGDSHPSIPTAFVFELSPESITTSGNQVKITVIYREFDQNYEYNLTADLGSQETTQYVTNQVNGDTDTVVLQYQYPADYLHEPKVAGLVDTQGLNSTIIVPRPRIIISRIERVTISADTLNGWPAGITLNGNILTDRNLIYSSTVNFSGWNIRSNDEQGTWMCMGISAVSIENGLAWRVTYTFSYNTLTWDVYATFKDPSTGDPVPNAILGVGTDQFPMYLLQDFTLLELS